MQYSQRYSLPSLFLASLPLALAASLATPAFGQVEDTGAQGSYFPLITGDGLTSYGQQTFGNSVYEAYRWTTGGGVEVLPNPIPASTFATANMSSDDGSIVVGYAAASSPIGFDPLGLRWDAAGNVTELTPPGAEGSEAFQISGDGSVAAGIYRGAGTNWHACVWDAAGTLTDIHPNFGGTFSTIIRISYDGSTVLGRGSDANGFARHFLWTASTGIVPLPTSSAGQIYPESISADGSAVVGRINLPTFNDFGIFYWSASSGFIVADPAIGEPSQVKISRDGNRVYGLVEFSVFTDEAAIFTWTPAAGFQFDQPNMEVTLHDASFDGSVLVGSMGAVSGPRQAYRWSSATSFVRLEGPTDQSVAYSVSLDGTVVSGSARNSASDLRPVVWRESGLLGANYCGPAVPNSTGTGGKIELAGSNIRSMGTLTLNATDLPQNAFGLFIASNQPGLIVAPGGSFGNLCMTGSILRLVGPGQIFNSGITGSASLTLNPATISFPGGPIILPMGERLYFQAWFRDADPVAGSNFTDGATVPLF